jgi:hypothetical protein
MVGCAAECCGGTIVNPLIAIAIKRSFFIDFPFYHKIGCRRLRGSRIDVLAFFTVNSLKRSPAATDAKPERRSPITLPGISGSIVEQIRKRLWIFIDVQR